VLIDVERFRAGVGVHRQMDAEQDSAEAHVLVLSPEYVVSPYCLHEMRRAVAADPGFALGRVVPVVRAECALPEEVREGEPVRVRLVDDGDGREWDRLMAACGAELGCTAVEWLRARDRVRDGLEDGQSVNLVANGEVKHRELVEQVGEELGQLAVVDLESGATVGRRNLVTEIIRAAGGRGEARRPPDDLADLDRFVMAAEREVRLALLHFDVVKGRVHGYKPDLFSALKHLVDKRKLVLLVESRAPFATLLPPGNLLSQVQMKTVELRGRTT
jgi:hypothetical protein